MESYVPRRVVCLQPSATATLAELGCLDRVVGCTQWCREVCPQVESADCTIIADSWTAKASQILSLCPDLVIASVPYQEKALAEILKSGARFLALAPKSLDDIYGDIATLARLMDAHDAGEQIIATMQAEISSVRVLCATASRTRIFCEEWGKPLIASQHWVSELVAAAGGEFVGKPGRQTDFDAVRMAEPDAIAMVWCGAGDRVPLERIIEQRGWQEMCAVRERRVFCIPDPWLNTPAHTLLQGLHALAAIAHPEIFPAPAGLRRIEERAASAAPRV